MLSVLSQILTDSRVFGKSFIINQHVKELKEQIIHQLKYGHVIWFKLLILIHKAFSHCNYLLL